MPATATRSRHAVAPIGTGHLHQALVGQRAQPNRHLDIQLAHDLMRSQGYIVSAPFKATHQPRHDQTVWLVDITLPNNGPSLRMGYFTSNAS